MDFSAIIQKIKDFYYKYEDKWYDILDKINEKVPVYKIIEPIDKVFPSFILFILIVLLILFSIIFLLIAPLLVPASLAITVSVSDSDGLPINSADVSVKLADDNSILNSGITDEFGEFKFDIEADEVEVIISVEAIDYEKKELKTSVAKGELVELTLKKIGGLGTGPAALGEAELYTIKVVDKQTKSIISNKDITLSLTCGSGSINPTYFEEKFGEFKVNKPKECTPLYAIAKAEGYVDSTKQAIIKNPYVIELAKGSLQETKGKLKITVYDEKNNTLPDVTVVLVTEDNTDEKEKVTDFFGSVLFDDLSPGKYNISATQQNEKGVVRTAEKSDVQVNSGKVNEESLEFKAFGDGLYKIVLKTIDKDKKEIPNVGITLYKNDVQLKVNNSKTGSDGKFSIKLDDVDKNANFKALLFKENYIPKVVTLNVIPKDSADVQEFALDAHDINNPSTYGKVQVKVLDEDGSAVEDALVTVFDGPTAIPYYANDTDESGLVLFEPLPAGTYYVKAENAEHSKFGKSETKALSLGETLYFEVNIITGKGSISVLVLDAKNGSKISGAYVEAYNIMPNPEEADALIAVCTTKQDGNCAMNNLSTDYQNVYIKVSKEEYYSYIVGGYYGSNIKILANDNLSLTAKLYEIESGDPSSGVIVKAESIYKEADLKPGSFVDVVGSDAEKDLDYYALFNMFIYEAEEDSNTAYFNARVGAEVSGLVNISEDDPIYIDSVEPIKAPSLKAVSVSSCADLSNPKTETLFKMPICPSQTLAGKSALLETAKLAKTVVPVIVHFRVRKGVEEGTTITIISNAKINNYTSVIDAQAATIIKQIGKQATLDELKQFCNSLVPPIEMLWQQISLSKPTEIIPGNLSSITPEERSLEDVEDNAWKFGTQDNPLLSKTDYFLGYQIFNCTNENKQNMKFIMEAEGQKFTISIEDSAASPKQELKNVEISSYSSFKEPSETSVNFDKAGGYTLDLNLLEGSSTLIKANAEFSVADLAFLGLKTNLDFLFPDQKNEITGTVFDKKNNLAVANATITLNKIYADQSEEIGSTTSDEKGTFSFTLAKPKINETYVLTASKNAFMPFSKTLKVMYPGNYSKLKCVKAKDYVKDTPFLVQLPDNKEFSFTLENQCTADLNVEFIDTESEFLYSKKKIELKAGESAEITITAEIKKITQGIHPIYVLASNSFMAKTPAGLIETIVLMHDSIFSIDSPSNFTFDFSEGLMSQSITSVLLNKKPAYQKVTYELLDKWTLDYFAVSLLPKKETFGQIFFPKAVNESANILATLSGTASCDNDPVIVNLANWQNVGIGNYSLDFGPVTYPITIPLMQNILDLNKEAQISCIDSFYCGESIEGCYDCMQVFLDECAHGEPTDFCLGGCISECNNDAMCGKSAYSSLDEQVNNLNLNITSDNPSVHPWISKQGDGIYLNAVSDLPPTELKFTGNAPKEIPFDLYLNQEIKGDVYVNLKVADIIKSD
ncbi:MAG: carboxypeptidase-like regulatory domain-containing protein [archaeon]